MTYDTGEVAEVSWAFIRELPPAKARLLGESPSADMIARVTLEIALRKEFDYFIPPELADQVESAAACRSPSARARCWGA